MWMLPFFQYTLPCCCRRYRNRSWRCPPKLQSSHSDPTLNKRTLAKLAPKNAPFQIKGVIKKSLRLSKADTKPEYYFELQNLPVGTIIILLMALDTYLRALWAVAWAPQSRFSSVLFQHSPLTHQLQACPPCWRVGKIKGIWAVWKCTPFFHSSKVGLLGSPQLLLHWRIHNRALIPALIFRHFAQTFNCNQWILSWR